MSEWGLVAFYYDYKNESSRFDKSNRTGLISKTYKYTNIPEMILHAFYGIKYFLENKDLYYHDNFDGRRYNNPLSNWSQLNTAFDVFFDFHAVLPGLNSVKTALNRFNETDSYKKIRQVLFNCEGTYGWLYFSYLENPVDGNNLKYGYYLYNGKHMEVMSLRNALNLYLERQKGKQPDTIFMEKIEEAILYIEQKADLMTRDDFREVEELGTNWVQLLHMKNAEENKTTKLFNTVSQYKQGKIEASAIILYDCELSVRCYNCLKRANIHTLGELKSAQQTGALDKVRGLNLKTRKEIETMLNQYFNP